MYRKKYDKNCAGVYIIEYNLQRNDAIFDNRIPCKKSIRTHHPATGNEISLFSSPDQNCERSPKHKSTSVIKWKFTPVCAKLPCTIIDSIFYYSKHTNPNTYPKSHFPEYNNTLMNECNIDDGNSTMYHLTHSSNEGRMLVTQCCTDRIPHKPNSM